MKFVSAAGRVGAQQLEAEKVLEGFKKTAGAVAVTESFTGVSDLVQCDMLSVESDPVILDLKAIKRFSFENSDENVFLAAAVPGQHRADEDVEKTELKTADRFGMMTQWVVQPRGRLEGNLGVGTHRNESSQF